MMSAQPTLMLDIITILMGNQVLFEDFFPVHEPAVVNLIKFMSSLIHFQRPLHAKG